MSKFKVFEFETRMVLIWRGEMSANYIGKACT